MASYPDFATYLSSRRLTLQERITTIDSVIEQLEASMLAAATAGKGMIKSYKLDSGQSVVETNYRSITEMANALSALELLRNRWVEQVYGTRVMKGRTSRGGGYKIGRIL